jgi:hypothetical protein
VNVYFATQDGKISQMTVSDDYPPIVSLVTVIGQATKSSSSAQIQSLTTAGQYLIASKNESLLLQFFI